ncbi:DciA family protein [Leucothrix pacifica]|uniref:DUF721 domain-containing protein n=1 Tax=Leucothrix pacifica TaxID=1247513 RepID=A0A317CN40_9GAMM|nr:DciA family protein [Leucothrix pacifica]PWQ99968.1 hypothetical protein DKW60_03960 [Leucothrix pacifica]
MKQTRTLQNSYITESIKNIDRLSERVREHLGVNASQQSLYVLPKQQEVVLVVDSPVFASQLRYQQNDILRFINTTFLSEFKRVKVKISPPVMQAKPKPAVHKELPKNIKDMLSGVRDELDN